MKYKFQGRYKRNGTVENRPSVSIFFTYNICQEFSFSSRAAVGDGEASFTYAIRHILLGQSPSLSINDKITILLDIVCVSF